MFVEGGAKLLSGCSESLMVFNWVKATARRCYRVFIFSQKNGLSQQLNFYKTY